MTRPEEFPDLRPAAVRMADLVRAVPDSMLNDPTPCPDYSLGDLLDHVGGFALAFTAGAQKDVEAAAAQSPSGQAARLEEGWRDRIAGDVIGLGEAWQDPAAWSGVTTVGVELPAEVTGLFALDELVVHGWDVARASRQPYHCDDASLEALHGLVIQLADPQADRAGLFGPVIEVAADEPLLDRIIGLTGRDPAW